MAGRSFKSSKSNGEIYVHHRSNCCRGYASRERGGSCEHPSKSAGGSQPGRLAFNGARTPSKYRGRVLDSEGRCHPADSACRPKKACNTTNRPLGGGGSCFVPGACGRWREGPCHYGLHRAVSREDSDESP